MIQFSSILNGINSQFSIDILHNERERGTEEEEKISVAWHEIFFFSLVDFTLYEARTAVSKEKGRTKLHTKCLAHFRDPRQRKKKVNNKGWRHKRNNKKWRWMWHEMLNSLCAFLKDVQSGFFYGNFIVTKWRC